MRKAELAQTLATSLVSSHWSTETLELTLVRRLPARLARIVPDLASALISVLPAAYAPSTEKVATALHDLHAFNLIWRFCQRYQVWPKPDLTSPRMAPVSAFNRLDLPNLPTLVALSEWLLLPMDRLDYLSDPLSRHEAHDEMAVNHYYYHFQTKRNGGVRLIEAPKPALKSIQRQILRGILSQLTPHETAFGFVPGRSCLEAAKLHTGEAVVLRFDLQSFFPSVTAPRIFGLYRALGYPHAVSRALTGLCTTATPPRVLHRLSPDQRPTFRTAHLPQGAPTSPALANQMCFKLDVRLSKLAMALNATYTRYADDLTFSGDAHIAATLLRAIPEIVAEEGFGLNVRKTQIMRHGARKTVTGVVVDQHINIDRRAFDRLKAVIHACAKTDDTRLLDARFRASLLGQIGWVETVNPARGQKLRLLLAKAWDRRFPET